MTTWDKTELEKFLDSLNPSKRRKAILNQYCSFCGQPAREFVDELSTKEYSISGLCSKCQDETFGRGDEDE